jgi:hypothetical protein
MCTPGTSTKCGGNKLKYADLITFICSCVQNVGRLRWEEEHQWLGVYPRNTEERWLNPNHGQFLKNNP